MGLVTVLWSMGAAVALTLAVVYGLAWLVERGDLRNLTFCLAALATAACARAELGLMHAPTAAEYAQWLRWYHPPVFIAFVALLLFVRSYLGAGRLWLLLAIVAARSVLLVCNMFVYPTFNYREIVTLRHVPFLGEEVSVVGETALRSWQWLALASLLLAIIFLLDAIVQARKRGPESRRRALVTFAAIVVPLACAFVLTQLVVFGIAHLPMASTPWFLITLGFMAWAVSRDIVTGRRARLQVTQLRSELAQLGRVNVLGQLAPALAHELVQPLSAIRGNVEAARRQLETEEPNLKELRAIVASIHRNDTRAGEIIERMRTLINRRSVEMQPLALDEVVQDVLALIRSEAASRRVLVECAMQPGLPHVSGDRVHLSQVLLNLLLNGMDAAQSGPATLPRVVIEARSDEAAGGVEMAVRDSGPGIPDGSIDKLFSPLFTTKAGGMGMGLALSRTIIEAHGGRLWAEQGSAGSGATFRFTLRRA